MFFDGGGLLDVVWDRVVGKDAEDGNFTGGGSVRCRRFRVLLKPFLERTCELAVDLKA